jgi:hypothetical protein
MLTAELAAMHGYASVVVKGHARRRAQEWQRMGREYAPAPKHTGAANVSGWEQLAATFEQMGQPVQRGGDRWVVN